MKECSSLPLSPELGFHHQFQYPGHVFWREEIVPLCKGYSRYIIRSADKAVYHPFGQWFQSFSIIIICIKAELKRNNACQGRTKKVEIIFLNVHWFPRQQQIKMTAGVETEINDLFKRIRIFFGFIKIFIANNNQIWPHNSSHSSGHDGDNKSFSSRTITFTFRWISLGKTWTYHSPAMG